MFWIVKFRWTDGTSTTRKCGGGTLIYVHNGLVYDVLDNFTSTGSESLWIKIKRKKCKCLYVCCIFRPEHHDVNSFIDSLEIGFSKLENLDRCDICILGDFNVDYPKLRNPHRHSFERFASQIGLIQIIKDVMCVTENSCTPIDLLFVNNTYCISQAGVLHISLSDIFLVNCIIKSGIPKGLPRLIDYHCFKNFDQSDYCRP